MLTTIQPANVPTGKDKCDEVLKTLMTDVLAWAVKKWDSKYSFSYDVKYNRETLHRALRNNFASGQKSNVEVEFSIIDGNSKKRLKGLICSVTSSGHGTTLPFNGYFELRFNHLWQKTSEGWESFLDEELTRVDYHDLIPEQLNTEITVTGSLARKWSDFVVLKIGWNPNVIQAERLECNFTQFFWKLMTSAEFNRTGLGTRIPFGSDLLVFED